MYSTHLARNTLSLRNVQRARKRLPRMFCAHRAPEPTLSPSQEGSNTGWPVPLLGGVRGGLVGARFMGREKMAPRRGELGPRFFDEVKVPEARRRHWITRRRVRAVSSDTDA